ncbi:MAG: flagellar brake protein [Candidatus Aquicultor sp.]
MQVEALDLVKAGQIIYIEDVKGLSWPFGVSNILNHELVVCHALGRKSTPLNTNALNTVTIVFPEENGAYLIKAAIDETDETKSRLVLNPTGEIDFVQRRQYFRLSKPSASAHYQLIEKEVVEAEIMPVEAMVWDISGSGIGMVLRSAKTIYTGVMMKLTVSISDGRPIEVIGEIVRVVPRSIIRNEYLIGINFKKIKETDRDRIIKFITQEQLSLRKVKKKA